MKAYRFLQDFKVGVGESIQPNCITAPCPAIYFQYQTVFKKGDVAQSPSTPVQPCIPSLGNPCLDLFMNPGYATTLRFIKNGQNYDVPSTMVTPVSVADAKVEAEKQKQWIFIIAALVVAYFLFKK